MPRAKSAVWKHFKRTADDKADDKSVKCMQCSANFTDTGKIEIRKNKKHSDC